MIEKLRHDSRVSCPIVCGNNMRATGFFFEARSSTYLITARHNVKPTRVSVPNTHTGGSLWSFTTQYNYSTIDVLLNTPDGWCSKHIDLRETESKDMLSDPSVDFFCVRVGFDPEKFGYTVFSPETTRRPSEENQSLILIGFNDFNDEVEPAERAVEGVTPSMVEFSNLHSDNPEGISPDYLGMGVDTSPNTDSMYNGLSGSPVLGEGLLGVHSGTSSIPGELVESKDDPLRMHYFTMRSINQFLD